MVNLILCLTCFQGQFNFVNIVIRPLDHGGNAVTLLAKQGLYPLYMRQLHLISLPEFTPGVAQHRTKKRVTVDVFPGEIFFLSLLLVSLLLYQYS
jgi:hypothetical protein